MRQTATARAPVWRVGLGCISLALLALLAPVLAGPPARAARPAAAGDFDPSFGQGGWTSTPFPYGTNTRAQALLVQPDGKYLVAGEALFPNTDENVWLARYDANGTLDSTFGQGGQANLVVPYATAYALALQPDGKIVVAGDTSISYTAIVVARYNANGTLDASFGTGGWVEIQRSADLRARGLVVQSGGRIVLAGSAPDQISGVASFLLLGFQPNGNPDPTFGSAGEVTTDFGAGSLADALLAQPDGKLIAAGSAGGDFALARYDANGALDAGFGSGGKVTTDFGGAFDNAYALALQSDGRLVAAGAAGDLQSGNFALARYDSNGQPDLSFGGSGHVTTTFPAGPSQAQSVVVQGGGIVAAGLTGANFTYQLALVRYQANGTPDPAFGSGGLVTTSCGQDQSCRGTAIAAAGSNLLVAGWTTPGAEESAVLARYQANGTLDPTFGTAGLVTTAAGASYAEGRSLAIQPDGKLVVAGTAGNCGQSCLHDGFSLARYQTNGTLDPTFGSGGTTSVSPPGQLAEGYSVVLQPDGKIVVAGYAGYGTDGEFAVARFLASGALDSAFGTGGFALTNVDETFRDAAFAVALQPDGKILAGGYTPYSGWAMTRYLPDGTLDMGFGSQGIVLTPIQNATAYIFALALQPDGKILAGGQADIVCSQTCPPEPFALGRYNADGSLDTTFGSGGIVTTNMSGDGDDRIYGLAVQPDGKILAGGSARITCFETCGSPNFALARYLSNGTLDPAFGSGGKVLTDFNGGRDEANALALQPDGAIILAGRAEPALNTTLHLALARYLPGGTLDAGFGSGGKVLTALPARYDEANAIRLDAQGRIVIAGDYTAATGEQFLVARFLASGGPAPTWTPVPAPSATTTVIATATRTPVPPSPTACPPGQFSDVHPTDYFYTPVQYLVSHGVVSGYGDCTFRPYADTTRSQMVKIVVLGFQIPFTAPAGGNYTFTDVQPSFPFYNYIETAAAHQIVSGYTCGGPGEPCDPQARPYFRPYNNVTRGQLAKITAVGAGWSLITPAQGTFADVPSGSPFYSAVETASCHGVISGYTCGGPGEPCDPQNRPYFRQYNDATRGQIAKIEYLALTGTAGCPAPIAAPR